MQWLLILGLQRLETLGESFGLLGNSYNYSRCLRSRSLVHLAMVLVLNSELRDYANLVRFHIIRFSPLLLRERDVARWRGISSEILIVFCPLLRLLDSQGTPEGSVIGAFASVQGHFLVPGLEVCRQGGETGADDGQRCFDRRPDAGSHQRVCLGLSEK